jgi:putative salt-induced outer membrane protein YdiY
MFQPFVQLALLAAAHAAEAAPSVPSFVAEPIVQDAAPAPAAPAWTGNISAGFVMTDGNSEMRQANASADATLKRENDAFTLGFLWVYAENNNAPNTDWTLTDRKTFGRGKYDYFFAEKTYAYGLATAENDLLQDISLRWTAGAGLGHQYLDTDTWKFAVEAGLAFLDTDYKNATDTDDLTVRGSTNTAYKASDTWSFAHILEAYPSVEDAEDVYGRSQLTADAKLSENMLASFKWVLDYDNTPVPGNDRVDNRYLLSVGWKF